ncbi:MAG: sugar transferase [Paracoccaceae bacterium]
MTIHFDRLNNTLDSASAPFGRVTLPARAGFYRNGLKRGLDLVLILMAAPIVLPLVLVLSLIVARDGHRPFYWSKRVGKDGKEFFMLKLRTMVPDADRLLDAHLTNDPLARQEWETTQKLKNDPRTTRVGRVLRKLSLDELPQLWNVLVGDMSLVGPRPMLPNQRVMYPGLAYYALRPGITGPWQVSDRNECEFAKRADHDKDYHDQLSFSADLKLIVRTIGVVLKGTGY